ncbi:MAG TPA: ATP-dependent Clp protease adapter ClpS [Alphaproteobacteria bacterium]
MDADPTLTHDDDPNLFPPQNPDGDKGDNGTRREAGSDVLLKSRPKTRRPSMYKVLLLNDDFTPMDFVVHILEKFFSKTRAEATDVMLHVHRRGVGICGIYTYEVAETKVTQVMDYARANEQPLQCTMEKE